MQAEKNGIQSLVWPHFQHLPQSHHSSKSKEYKYKQMDPQFIEMTKQSHLKFQINQPISKMIKMFSKSKKKIQSKRQMKMNKVRWKQILRRIYDKWYFEIYLIFFFFKKLQQALQIFWHKQNYCFYTYKSLEEMNQTSQSYFSVGNKNALQEISNSQRIRRSKKASSKSQYGYDLIEQDQQSRDGKNDQISQFGKNNGSQTTYKEKQLGNQKEIKRLSKDSFEDTNLRLNINISEPNENNENQMPYKFQYNAEEPGNEQIEQKHPQYLNANQKIQIKIQQQTRPVSQKTQQRPKTSNKQRQIIQIQNLSNQKDKKNRQMIIGMAQIKQNFFGSVKEVTTSINGQNIFLVRKSCMMIQSPNFYMYRNINMGNDQIGYLKGNLSGSLYNFYYTKEKMQSVNCLLMMTLYFPTQSLFSVNKPKKFQIFIRKTQEQISNENDKNLKELYEQDIENQLKITKLLTKDPTWIPQKQCYAMNFKGLCQQPSVQNFILIEQKSKKQLMFFCKNNDLYSYRVSNKIQDSLVAAIIATTLDFKWISQ